ncbi:MAG: hypothetical protein OEY74_06280 [Gammaproteobacteria bacterium]|nr:hypothetical protein [Gammaproteobacteria bacterium]
MFKVIRVSIMLFILLFVGLSTYLTQARSTDWNNSLWIKIYPINGDGSTEASKYIAQLATADFEGIESFLQRETQRYARNIARPVRIELGGEIHEQPPALGKQPNALSVMLWSLKMRWWAGRITDAQDRIDPDVRIFVRYHKPDTAVTLENSVGLQKGMVGIVNGYASRRHRGTNNVIIAHEFLHTLGATDKYSASSGLPTGPDGLGEPDRRPLYPQRYAEIMGGRIALAEDDAVIPKSLKYAVIGALTASEINLSE